MFTDCTTKVDSEPLNGSNKDITNPYECDQTLHVSAGILKLSAVTPHYLPKVREYVFVKPNHVIAFGSSGSSSKESYGSNDMAHNYYLEEAKKKTQNKNMNLKPSKCVFNVNHDACLTKFLKEVNSRIKVQSPKTRNNMKPVEKITNVIKPKIWISKGHRFSPNKSFAVHEKPNTPRSCLRWKLTGRIFKTTSLRWIPTGKMFTDCTTKVDSEPLNGSNKDITNPYECDQTLHVSAGHAPSFLTPGQISTGLVPNLVPTTPYVPPRNKELKILFQPMFDEYIEPPCVERPVSPATAVQVPFISTGTPSSTTIDQVAPSPSRSSPSSELQPLYHIKVLQLDLLSLKIILLLMLTTIPL
uniref:Uncharacterized protein n=1 Tax=Tanacetum cinerariifolium TaxID=118510 RepID=A0A699KVE3_TANCI|nr:hypothetical protein [Tanacetum cinerariifolium]